MRKDRGFTLIELLIVVAIIGIIAAIAIPNLLNAINRGRQKRSMADMRTIADAVEQYQVDYNAYPKVSSATVDVLIPYLTPTYVKKLPVNDGWNTKFAWIGDTSGLDYTIICYGKNRSSDGIDLTKPRTTSFNADIYFSNGSFVQWPEGMQVD